MSRELSRMGRFLRGFGAYLLALLAALALSAITGTPETTAGYTRTTADKLRSVSRAVARSYLD